MSIAECTAESAPVQMPNNREWLYDAVDLFHHHVRAGGCTARAASNVSNDVRRAIRAMRAINKAGAISAAQIESYLRGLRSQGKSATTCNQILTRTKRFYSWLVAQDYLDKNPIASAKAFRSNAGTRKRIRRLITQEELERFIAAAESGPTWHEISGRDRAMLYRVMVMTGLRLGECFATRTRDWHPIERFVQPPHTNNGDTPTLPLRADLCELLAPWLATKQPAWHPWRIWPRDKASYFGSAIVKRDMEAAGIPRHDAKGHVFDLHSLRHIFCTNLVKAGLPPKVVQLLARHSDIATTMRYYVHIGDDELAAALEQLPPLRGPA